VVDLRRTARRHRRIIAVIAAAALLVPAAAFGAAGRDQAAAQLQLRQELLGESFVTDVSETDQVVRVDVAQDPAAAAAWLDETATVLDGWTIVVAGMDRKSGKERAKLDRKAFAADPPAEPSCPDIPEGPRSKDGSTTPLLGCGAEKDVQLTAGAKRATKGGPARTLKTAVDDVLASYLPDADLAPTKVRITKGRATVDVASGFVEALSDAGVYPGDVWQALLFTAHSNGDVDSVKFTLDGDCLAFAYATGGDMCVSTDLPIDLD
jgi:hypothetical protein